MKCGRANSCNILGYHGRTGIADHMYGGSNFSGPPFRLVLLRARLPANGMNKIDQLKGPKKLSMRMVADSGLFM